MQEKIQQQKQKNFWYTLLLFGGMLALMLALGYFLVGWEGMIWAGALGALMLYLSTRIPAKYVMRIYRARPLSPREAPHLARLIRQLSQRAGLKEEPELYFIPQRNLNAFATGSNRDPAIGLTYGILRTLNLRELTGVLAHEISHVRNNDFRLKSLINVVSRITRLFSFVGQVFLLINLPFIFMGETAISWWAILLLLVAPALSGLMMMAISRTRELDADLDAARITGDPNGLADALKKLHYYNQGSILERMAPRTLSSHPTIEERVKKLRQLAPRYEPQIDLPESEWVQLESPFFQRNRFWV